MSDDSKPVAEIDNLAITREMAAALHPEVMRKIVDRALDDTISNTSLLAFSDHLGKVSGLYAKTEQKNDQGRFIFNIHLGTASEPQTLTIDCSSVENSDDFGALPSYMGASEGNLAQITIDSNG